MAESAARLLQLLSLLTSRPQWTAVELAGRLEVTDRTLRRDIERLRVLGYPVHSTRPVLRTWGLMRMATG
jgi:predicted DNA-binding transcriptional regulator YafY